MIYGQSPDPIKIRKIRLKIWKFRDELESIISQRLQEAHALEGEEGLSEDGILSDLKERYRAPRAAQEIQDNVLLFHRVRPALGTGKMVNGVVALMDMDMRMISCFCDQQFISGQTIVVEFLVPTYFFVTAEVLECRHYNRSSKIISQHRPGLRLHAKWIYHLPEERAMLRRFLKSVELQPAERRPPTPSDIEQG